MNGSEVALVEYAQRSARAARECADALVESKQAWERVEVTQGEQARELKRLASAVAVLVQRPKQTSSHSITEDDWEDSPTGTHKQISRHKFEQWTRERELSSDAKKWRKVLNTSGKIALLIVMAIVGALIRHLLKP